MPSGCFRRQIKSPYSAAAGPVPLIATDRGVRTHPRLVLSAYCRVRTIATESRERCATDCAQVARYPGSILATVFSTSRAAIAALEAARACRIALRASGAIMPRSGVATARMQETVANTHMRLSCRRIFRDEGACCGLPPSRLLRNPAATTGRWVRNTATCTDACIAPLDH